MKTLYVSDLDGTLLNSQQQTSTYTNQTIEKLVDQGCCFLMQPQDLIIQPNQQPKA